MDGQQQHTRHRPSASNNPELGPHYNQSTQQRVNPSLNQIQPDTALGNRPHDGRAQIASQVPQAMNLQGDLPQQYLNPTVQASPPSAVRGPYIPLSPQAINMGDPFIMDTNQRSLTAPSPAAPSPQMTLPSARGSNNMVASLSTTEERGSSLPTARYNGPLCKLPGCRQPRCFDHYVQEQLDYCETHVGTALSRGFAARCERCGRLPARDDSKYCSESCRRGDSGGASSSVPPGFMSACQECRRPMQNTGRRFCSLQCENANRLGLSHR